MELNKQAKEHQGFNDSERIDLIFNLLQTELYAILELGAFELTWDDEIAQFQLSILDKTGEGELLQFKSGREAIDFVLTHELDNEVNPNTESEN